MFCWPCRLGSVEKRDAVEGIRIEIAKDFEFKP